MHLTLHQRLPPLPPQGERPGQLVHCQRCAYVWDVSADVHLHRAHRSAIVRNARIALLAQLRRALARASLAALVVAALAAVGLGRLDVAALCGALLALLVRWA